MKNGESHFEDTAKKFIGDIEKMLTRTDLIKRQLGYDDVTFSALSEDKLARSERATKSVLEEAEDDGDEDVHRYINRY